MYLQNWVEMKLSGKFWKQETEINLFKRHLQLHWKLQKKYLIQTISSGFLFQNWFCENLKNDLDTIPWCMNDKLFSPSEIWMSIFNLSLTRNKLFHFNQNILKLTFYMVISLSLRHIFNSNDGADAYKVYKLDIGE